MANTTPNFMSQKEFEKAVKDWGLRIKKRALGNLIFHTKVEIKANERKKLIAAVNHYTRKKDGEINRVGFGFEAQGIYLHYGVGRGYVREGGKVEKRMKEKRAVKSKSGKTYLYDKERERKPYDWLDVEIREGMAQLARYVQEYHGDRAMQKVLEMVERMTIEKK